MEIGMELVLWFIIGLIINTFIFSLRYDNKNPELIIWVTPKDVYDTTHMNWFGAITTYLLMFIINPFWYTIKLIWWICHVGR